MLVYYSRTLAEVTNKTASETLHFKMFENINISIFFIPKK
nr:MAG TPA: hypothetical protein [Caudoviricetes sp.]